MPLTITVKPCAIWVGPTSIEEYPLVSVFIICASSITAILLMSTWPKVNNSLVQGVVVFVVYLHVRCAIKPHQDVRHVYRYPLFIVIIYSSKSAAINLREPRKLNQEFIFSPIHSDFLSSCETYPSAGTPVNIKNPYADFGAWLGHFAEIAELRLFSLFPATLRTRIVVAGFSFFGRITSRLDSLFKQVHDLTPMRLSGLAALFV
jgi:hypothetical protein